MPPRLAAGEANWAAFFRGFQHQPAPVNKHKHECQVPGIQIASHSEAELREKVTRAVCLTRKGHAPSLDLVRLLFLHKRSLVSALE